MWEESGVSFDRHNGSSFLCHETKWVLRYFSFKQNRSWFLRAVSWRGLGKNKQEGTTKYIMFRRTKEYELECWRAMVYSKIIADAYWAACRVYEVANFYAYDTYMWVGVIGQKHRIWLLTRTLQQRPKEQRHYQQSPQLLTPSVGSSRQEGTSWSSAPSPIDLTYPSLHWGRVVCPCIPSRRV